MQCGQRLPQGAGDPVEASRAGRAAGPAGTGDAAADPQATELVQPRRDPARRRDVELVACPACGSSNTARRLRCGRCGTSLHPDLGPGPAGEPGPDEGDDAWTPPPATEAHPGEDTAPRRGRRRGAAVAVITLGLVVGTGLGLAAGMGMGPFARAEPVPFDDLAYPDEPTVQRPATVGASSTAGPDGSRTFEPTQTVDGRLTTAWRADDEDSGALVRHGFVAPVWVAEVEVATGDQYDDTAFSAVGRVVEARIDLGTMQVEATLAGVDGVQVIPLPRPVLTDEITWEVTDVVGEPAAISEVRYVGWQADAEDDEAYQSR